MYSKTSHIKRKRSLLIPLVPTVEHRAYFLGFLILYRQSVGLLWTSDQPIENASTYTGRHNTATQIQTYMLDRDSNAQSQQLSGQDLRFTPRGHRDRHGK
jgi:hypothetical protein